MIDTERKRILAGMHTVYYEIWIMSVKAMKSTRDKFGTDTPENYIHLTHKIIAMHCEVMMLNISNMTKRQETQ